jgi:hypothetical protein
LKELKQSELNEVKNELSLPMSFLLCVGSNRKPKESNIDFKTLSLA